MIKGTFLGTGSIPTSERNSQGTLLEFNNTTTVLVDCGEGIQRQILNVDTDLKNISAIFLTHSHIDHIYGVGGMLTLLLHRYPEKKLRIYAPKQTIDIVEKLVDLFIPEKAYRVEYIQVTENDSIETDHYNCTPFKTFHTEDSLGYCFQVENRKIAIFGDVGMPNVDAHEKMVESATQADIAIIDGVHISVEEASKIAKDADVGQLYLMPILLGKNEEEVIEQAGVSFPDTYIPKDFQQFNIV